MDAAGYPQESHHSLSSGSESGSQSASEYARLQSQLEAMQADIENLKPPARQRPVGWLAGSLISNQYQTHKSILYSFLGGFGIPSSLSQWHKRLECIL